MVRKHSGEDSVILEAGLFSFFIRGRVGTDGPNEIDSLNSIARSYILLRPIARAEEPVKQVLAGSHQARVLILPKKALPSKGERFMAFVAKARASDAEIKDELAASADYETQSAGTHHTPAAVQVCEGTYVLSSAAGGRETHLVYAVTVPACLDRFQREQLRIQERGSFLVSTKNPAYKGPGGAQLALEPDFSEEILSEFRSLRWVPSKPGHLDYENAQVLLIGERSVVDQEGDQYDDELEVKIEEE